MQVYRVLTSSPLSVSIRISVRPTWEALQSQNVGHLPVVDEHRELVGMLSDRNFRAPPGPISDVLGGAGPSPNA
jgi:CBS domain-containing protein